MLAVTFLQRRIAGDLSAPELPTNALRLQPLFQEGWRDRLAVELCAARWFSGKRRREPSAISTSRPEGRRLFPEAGRRLCLDPAGCRVRQAIEANGRDSDRSESLFQDADQRRRSSFPALRARPSRIERRD